MPRPPCGCAERLRPRVKLARDRSDPGRVPRRALAAFVSSARRRSADRQRAPAAAAPGHRPRTGAAAQRRGAIAVLALLALSLVSVRASGEPSTIAPDRSRPRPAAAAPLAGSARPGVRARGSGRPRQTLDWATAPRDTGRAGSAPAAARGRTRSSAAHARGAGRRAGARRLRRSRSVEGALRRAWLAGAISRRRHDELRGVWWRARRDARRLRGRRAVELRAVVAIVRRLARGRRLTASRLEPVFLTLRRNRLFWTSAPLPLPGARTTFGRDPVVFQYYAGRGLAIQPLASFGAANALAASCLRRTTTARCRPARLRRLLRRMVDLGTRTRGFLAWEYLFPFGGGAPPWISAMTQATGAQALVRGARALGDQRLDRAAGQALGAFEAPPPRGIAVGRGRSRRYAMYSFAPRLRILNGELQALIGLSDVARIAASRRARRLYVRGERLARSSVGAYDTGAWSLYSWGGAESTLDYHRLLTGFLDGLCRRTGRAVYCAAGRRFRRYVDERPRLRLRPARRLRARRRTVIRFTLSKVSHVVVRVRDRRGRIELARGLRGLPRGRHGVVWLPRRAGRHRLRIVAIGPGGTRTVVVRTVRVARRAPA